MNDAAANPPALGLAESKPGEGWSRARWLSVIALVFAVHVALIFLFGEKKTIVPRAVTNVPRLNFADKGSPLLALNDPTLFAPATATGFRGGRLPENARHPAAVVSLDGTAAPAAAVRRWSRRSLRPVHADQFFCEPSA